MGHQGQSCRELQQAWQKVSPTSKSASQQRLVTSANVWAYTAVNGECRDVKLHFVGASPRRGPLIANLKNMLTIYLSSNAHTFVQVEDTIALKQGQVTNALAMTRPRQRPSRFQVMPSLRDPISQTRQAIALWLDAPHVSVYAQQSLMRRLRSTYTTAGKRTCTRPTRPYASSTALASPCIARRAHHCARPVYLTFGLIKTGWCSLRPQE